MNNCLPNMNDYTEAKMSAAYDDTTSRKKKKTKKMRKKILIEGPDDFDPFQGFKKLLSGFCDPMKQHDDDNTTIATTPTCQKEFDEEKVIVEDNEGKDLSYGLQRLAERAYSPWLLEEKRAREIEVKEPEAEAEPEQQPEPPTLKATHEGPGLRVQRGIEVALVAFLAVFVTLFALHRMGYKFDLQVMSAPIIAESRNWIQVVYNDNENSLNGGLFHFGFMSSLRGEKN